jgi:hypothetical protein
MKNLFILAIAGGTLLVGCSETVVNPQKKVEIPQTMTIRHDVYVHHSGSMDVKISGAYGSDVKVEVKTK